MHRIHEVCRHVRLNPSLLQMTGKTHHKEAESKSRAPLRLRLFWNAGNVPPFALVDQRVSIASTSLARLSGSIMKFNPRPIGGQWLVF